jgi:hypothetical protein
MFQHGDLPGLLLTPITRSLDVSLIPEVEQAGELQYLDVGHEL